MTPEQVAIKQKLVASLEEAMADLECVGDDVFVIALSHNFLPARIDHANDRIGLLGDEVYVTTDCPHAHSIARRLTVKWPTREERFTVFRGREWKIGRLKELGRLREITVNLGE
jgi:hypothetical protein